ncbi:MAG TPA: hypothetical protein VJR89_19455, partial [Polyangiales bacterium]|nr:hypothetical protein [Polyangiales bacterium]
MTELGRDARALVTRVKRSDGPSALDRERLRKKLEPAWAAQRAELTAAADPTALPRLAQSWWSWTSGLVLLSLGFIAPELPRTAAPLPAATTLPLPAAEAAPRTTAAEPTLQPKALE